MPWKNFGPSVPHISDARVAIHAALVFALGYFAFVLAKPDDTFSASYSFTVMQSIMSELHWAFLFACMTGIGIWGISSRNRSAKLVSAGVLSFGHATIAICFYLGGIGHPLLPGTGIYSTVAGLGIYLVWGYRQ